MQTINPPPKKTQNFSNPFVFHTSTLEMQSLHFLRERRAQARRLSGSSNPHAGNNYHVGLDPVRDHRSSLQSCELYMEKQQQQQVLITQFWFSFQDTLNRCWRVHHMMVNNEISDDVYLLSEHCDSDPCTLQDIVNTQQQKESLLFLLSLTSI